MTTARPRSQRPPTTKGTRKASTKKATAKKASTKKATAKKASTKSTPAQKASSTPAVPSGNSAHVDSSISSLSHDAALDCVRGLLAFMGDDPTREGLRETPERVLRSYAEHFSGYGQDPSEHLAKTFSEVEDYDELVLVSDIEVFSHCEHHLVPFVGKAHVAYIPDGRVVGLSKLARVVDVFAKRLQVQEKLTAQIAGAIQGHLHPLGVAVVLQCQHFCMCYRGVRKPGSWTTTSKLHGLFLSDSAARMELLTLIGLHREIGGAGGA